MLTCPAELQPPPPPPPSPPTPNPPRALTRNTVSLAAYSHDNCLSARCAQGVVGGRGGRGGGEWGGGSRSPAPVFVPLDVIGPKMRSEVTSRSSAGGEGGNRFLGPPLLLLRCLFSEGFCLTAAGHAEDSVTASALQLHSSLLQNLFFNSADETQICMSASPDFAPEVVDSFFLSYNHSVTPGVEFRPIVPPDNLEHYVTLLHPTFLPSQ